MPSFLLIGIRVEALSIAWIPYRWNDRPSVLPIVDVFPVDAFKERVRFDASGSTLDIPKALVPIYSAQLQYQILGGRGNKLGVRRARTRIGIGNGRKSDWLVENSSRWSVCVNTFVTAEIKENRIQGITNFHILLVDFHRLLMPEGRIPGQKFIEQDAKSPPVYSSGMAQTLNDFRSQVLRCAAQCICFPWFNVSSSSPWRVNKETKIPYLLSFPFTLYIFTFIRGTPKEYQI